MHGILEWILPIAVIVLGFIFNRWVPLRKVRYSLYAVILFTAFIFDLNKIAFASDTVNSLSYLTILIALSEIVWICEAKKNRLLLGGALIVFAPLFIYVYTAAMVILPFPCHSSKNAVVDRFSCGSTAYVLRKRPSLDIFEPGHIYILCRAKGVGLFEKRVDRYTTPQGYYSACISPKHQCMADGIKIDLYVDNNYVLWSLGEKITGNN
ncbi:MAG: hypothetical protein LBI42_06135 [Chitinispirillales bacterium]|jgi:hypothetical protein|nr:hypothetical protein [Chitinispirillales bacterium]